MLLNETLVVSCQIIESDQNKLPAGVLKRGIWPICNIGQLNQNDRVYERAVWEKVMADDTITKKQESRTLFGQAEHPEKTQSDLQLTSHVITRTFIDTVVEEGKEFERAFQEIDILDTPCGRIINTLIEAKCKVGVSTRAEGDLEESEDERGKFQRVIPESYNYVTTDFTADPSTFNVAAIAIESNLRKELKRELENESLKPGERQFAVALLESINKRTGKQQTIEQLINDEMIKLGVGVVIKEGKYRGIKAGSKIHSTIVLDKKTKAKVSAISEGQISFQLPDGTTISAETSKITTDTVEIILPEGGFEDANIEQEELEVEAGIGEDPNDVTGPPQKEIDQMAAAGPPPFESVDEAKMGVDYVKSMKGYVKKASACLKDKDYDGAASALEDAADDASDAARAAKKMKRAAEEKDVADKEKAAKKESLTEQDGERLAPGAIVELDGGNTAKIIRSIDDNDPDFEELRSATEELYGERWENLGDRGLEPFKPWYVIQFIEEGPIKGTKGKIVLMSIEDVDRVVSESIKESFDDMVKWMQKRMKEVPVEDRVGLSNLVRTKLLNENIKPSTTAKVLRKMQIEGASSRAERDEAFRLLDEAEEKIADTTGGILEVRILRKKLGESKDQSDEVKALCDGIEKRAEKLKETKAKMGELAEAMKKMEEEHTILIEGLKAEHKKATKVLTESIAVKYRKQLTEKYIELKLHQSGLRIHKNARALLEKCETPGEVDEIYEDVKEAMKRAALQPGVVEAVKVNEIKVEDKETGEINSLVKTSMSGMH